MCLKYLYEHISLLGIVDEFNMRSLGIWDSTEMTYNESTLIGVEAREAWKSRTLVCDLDAYVVCLEPYTTHGWKSIFDRVITSGCDTAEIRRSKCTLPIDCTVNCMQMSVQTSHHYVFFSNRHSAKETENGLQKKTRFPQRPWLVPTGQPCFHLSLAWCIVMMLPLSSFSSSVQDPNCRSKISTTSAKQTNVRPQLWLDGYY